MVLMAMQRFLPTDAVFSGATAGWLLGLDLAPCSPAEVTVPDASWLRPRARLSVARTSLGAAEVVCIRGLPATSAVRTITDLGRRSPLYEAVIAIDEALHKGIVSCDDLSRFAAARAGAKGIGRLRVAIDLAEPATESPMETRLRLLIVTAGLPRPAAQVAIYEQGEFLGRPDLLYEAQRLVIEYDGGTHRESLAEDNRRQNRLVGAGYRILRFTSADVYRAPTAVVAQVRAALR